MDSREISLHTGDAVVTDVTEHIRHFCRGRGDGLCHVFAPHATAGLALIETGAGSEPDLAEAVERLLPRDDRYRHRHGSRGHGGDHVLPAFVSPSLVLAVRKGEPRLGTWQSVVFVDPNLDNAERRLWLSFLPST
ncbi:MAG TPA: YjbQ family protein [Acidimicrobiales bacterium]|jgi:secondary thiamine-phosphate synthase enzyme|nr:YjbQ family protein [Acidimicrobiales bacterium]